MDDGIRKIIHVDMDAFYASVEQLDQPKFRGKPVIVGGNPQKRGVVAACSYEARQYGVHSAMPCSRAVQRCPHAIFTAPRMWRYREVSQQVMGIFQEITSLVEPLSLDEAFLDVTQNTLNNPSATRLAEIIRQKIKKDTGLTASAGVSYNKFLAKIASDLHKPDGLSIILPEHALSFLDNLPVGKFFGVGRVTEQKMARLGIIVGKDLRRFSKDDLIYHFGKTGSFYYNIVRGIDDRPVRPERERKSIGSETTLQQDTVDLSQIDDILSNLADKIEKVLEEKKCGASTLTLKVRYHDFITITRSLTLSAPIYTAERILANINRLKSSTDLGQRKARLLGISLSKLTCISKKKPVQLMLPFD
jgi:DNA polymerase IV